MSAEADVVLHPGMSVVVPPLSEAQQMSAMIERLASNPAVDVDKLERLLQMRERMQAKDAEAEFNAAMSLAQAEMRRIATDAENPQTRSRYATYGKLDSIMRPIYVKHGFALSFDEGDSPKEQHIRVLCYVSHKAGHTRTYHKDMPADGKGAKGGDVMSLTHASGAASSYGMRYLLRMIFNVAIGEEDNDGNGVLPTLNEKQAADLLALLTETGADVAQFKRWAKVSELSQILAKNFDYVCSEVRARAANRGAK